MQKKDLHKPGLGGLNTDDNPSVLPPGDYPDGLNIRTGSSSEKHGTGNVETLQGEIELLLGVEALTYYYGAAIGGEFIYSGYEEVTIGTQSWMKRNWDYNYPGSKVYNDVDANASIYGRLYNHQQVMASNFSPPGWRVPTEADIDTLLTYLGGQMIAGGKMKEVGTDHWNTPNTSADDISGFRALPGGEFDTVFDLLGGMGLFWLQDEAAPTTPTALPATDIDTTTFLANWQIETGPTGYYLDVATDALFTAFVAGFNNLNVGLVSFYNITGLAPDTTYYYRVRAYNEIGASASSNAITLDTVFAVADVDGNIYTTVIIGAQEWFVENLRTTKFRDGSPITEVVGNAAWVALITEGYCKYNNDPLNIPDYGLLYNWYAVDHHNVVAGAHLAPAGWRIPSLTDLETLCTYLGGLLSGGKLKEIGTSHWLAPNLGATDEYGFKALPGGYRAVLTGLFLQQLDLAVFGASTLYIPDLAYSDCLQLSFVTENPTLSASHKTQGVSIRCMRDVV